MGNGRASKQRIWNGKTVKREKQGSELASTQGLCGITPPSPSACVTTGGSTPSPRVCAYAWRGKVPLQTRQRTWSGGGSDIQFRSMTRNNARKQSACPTVFRNKHTHTHTQCIVQGAVRSGVGFRADRRTLGPRLHERLCACLLGCSRLCAWLLALPLGA